MDLLPFVVPGCGVWFAVLGAWGLFSRVRPTRRIDPESDLNSESSALVKARVRARLRMRRIGGIFWFCVGIATFWHSNIRVSWVLPSIGLFWAIVGAWQFGSTFRQHRQAALAAEAYSELAASRSEALRRRLRQLFASAVSLCLGITMLCFSGLVCTGTVPEAVSQPQVENRRLARIVTQRVDRDFADQGRVGLVVGAVSNNEEVLLGFGTRQLGKLQPPDADTVFEIGSISKVFTGILLAQRIESGEMEVDDRIAELLPEGWTLSKPAREITLRHCTIHTSGIPSLPANWFTIRRAYGSELTGADPYRDYSEEEFRRALATVELDFAPGTDRSYSNFAVGLLGFVLATQNGTDYETLVTRGICEPLGMHSTKITGDKWLQEHFAAKYRAALPLGGAMFAVESDEWQLPNHFAGAGALRSTGRDMMTFLKANMGRISTPIDAAIRRSHEELFQDDADSATGMNWRRSFDTNISQNVIRHNGGTGGFRSYLGFTEDHQFGVFVLSNTATDVDFLAKDILQALVQEYAPDSRKTVTKHGYAEVAPYTGIRWENDRPIVEVNGRWSPLVSIDGIPIERIIEFSQQEFKDKARKRIAEDLVEVLSKMGHEPKWEVTLGLETSDGQVEELEVTMTAENRRRVTD